MKSLRLKFLSLGLKFIVPKPNKGIGLPSLRNTIGFESILFVQLPLLLYNSKLYIIMLHFKKIFIFNDDKTKA